MSQAPVQRPIGLIKVRGSHRSVGRQIGEACGEVVRSAADLEKAGVPKNGMTLDELIAEAAFYRAKTEEHMPFLCEELDGVAEAAGVDQDVLFAASIEELWASPPSQPASGSETSQGRCSDVLASGPATGGRVLIAHNNDLSAKDEDDVVAIERDVPGEPTVFSIGIGPWISVGWNSAGLSLTGNELSPNDERRGIPRLLLVRAQLRARTMAEAVEVALHPARASAYNTVYAHADGSAVNIEASATACAVTEPNSAGTIVHTNHYVEDEMLAFEGDPEYACKSRLRLDRARELLAAHAPGSVGEEELMAILADHANAPDSICRHGEGEAGTKTVFWCIADVAAGRIRYGRGNPCTPSPEVFSFFD